VIGDLLSFELHSWLIRVAVINISMHQSAYNVLVSRSIVALLMALVWGLYFLNARFAYRSFSRRKLLQLLLVVGSAAIFCLQVFTMESLSPEDAYGNHFLFIFAECGGAMLILFWTLLRERAKARSKPLERN
jgi:hypothetical protein